MKKKPPFIPSELLEHLEGIFPDKAPRETEITPTEVGALIGVQKVLDHLRQLHSRQNPMDH